MEVVPKPQRPKRVRKVPKKVKKIIKKDVKNDVKKEVKKEVEKEVFKAKPKNSNLKLKQIRPRMAKDVEKIILSFTLPFEYPMQRVQIGYNNTKVAVANPFFRFNSQWNITDDTVGYHQPPSEMVVFQFRDLLRAAVIYHGALEEGRYDLLDSKGGTTQDLGPSQDFKNIIFQRARYNIGFQAHGPYLYPGVDIENDEGAYFFWVDSYNSSSRILVSFAAATSNGTIRLKKWQPAEDVVSDFPYVITDTDVEVIIPDSGYYALSYSSVNQITLFSAQIYFVDTDIYRHYPVPFIETNFGALGATSILAYAHVVTNNAPVISKGGNVARLQVPKSQFWYESRTFDLVSSYQNSETIGYVNGSYSWAKLEDTTDIAFNSQVVSVNGKIERMTFTLEPQSSYLVTCAQSATIGGRSAYLNMIWGLCYQTLDPWRSIAEPLYSGKELNEALDALAKMKQHTENPFHFRKLLNEAKKFSIKAVPYIERYGPMAFKMLSNL